jgi:hypothetical protein
MRHPCRSSADQKIEGRDADLSRQRMRRWFGADRRGKSASRDREHRRRRGRCFTLGGGSADGVRVRGPTRIPCASPRLFMFGGLLLRLLNRASEVHARSHRSSHRFEHWPTALQRSDGRSLRARRRCRIDFRAMLRRRDFFATTGPSQPQHVSYIRLTQSRRHSGAMRSIEPGTQGVTKRSAFAPGFRVCRCAAPRNDEGANQSGRSRSYTARVLR